MEVFQQLKIVTKTKNQIDEIFDFIIEGSQLKSWEIEYDFIANYKKNMIEKDKSVLCLLSPVISINDKYIQGYLWFGEWKKNLEVFNIVPTQVGSLNYSEYNSILNKFYLDFIEPYNQLNKIEIIKTSDQLSLEDIAGKEVTNALKSFSYSANKSTGNSHPMDAERWNYFVCLAHKCNSSLTSDELVRWLEEEDGWNNEEAWDLGVDYEKSINLLKYYDENF